ncbi:putative tetratricopeptide-like helical domain superfamily [Septoria linicola]|nr:putative tetratricopeptide-like helical domain superfamily [Septoria linicola]
MAIELLETTARAIQTQDSSTYCKICGEIVDIHVDAGQFEKAAGSLKSIINVIRQASDARYRPAFRPIHETWKRVQRDGHVQACSGQLVGAERLAQLHMQFPAEEHLLRIRMALGKVYENRGDTAATVKLMEDVIRKCAHVFPLNREILLNAQFTLAFAYRASGKLAASIAVMEQSVQLLSGRALHERVWYELALLQFYIEGKQLDQAQSLYERLRGHKEARDCHKDLLEAQWSEGCLDTQLQLRLLSYFIEDEATEAARKLFDGIQSNTLDVSKEMQERPGGLEDRLISVEEEAATAGRPGDPYKSA